MLFFHHHSNPSQGKNVRQSRFFHHPLHFFYSHSFISSSDKISTKASEKKLPWFFFIINFPPLFFGKLPFPRKRSYSSVKSNKQFVRTCESVKNIEFDDGVQETSQDDKNISHFYFNKSKEFPNFIREISSDPLRLITNVFFLIIISFPLSACILAAWKIWNESKKILIMNSTFHWTLLSPHFRSLIFTKK